MAVYDLTGSSVFPYDLAGADLSAAYDLEGNGTYAAAPAPPPYSIDNVVSYFRERTEEVCEEINALNNKWQSVIFITDPHGAANEQHSQPIALYLLANSKAKMLVLGGDYSDNNWSLSEYSTWVAPFLESDYIDRIYACYGNHETYGTNARAESLLKIYQDFLQSKTANGHPESLYYYFDDAPRKTRFLFINTSDYGDVAMTDAQISWIGSAVTLPGNDWSVIAFGHVNLDDLNGVTTMNEVQGSTIINALKSGNGHFVGYICGHQHIDGLSSAGRFRQAMLYCDKFENKNWYDDYSITDRVAGTISEQAVSVVSFNTATKNVVIRRIGVGHNQTRSYQFA